LNGPPSILKDRFSTGLARTKSIMETLMNRRTLLKSAATLVGAAATALPSSEARADAQEPTVLASAHNAIVDTQCGKVAGYVRKGIFTYKGIPYGDTTEGAGRFLPPRPAKPWSGVRSSRQYGPIAPQSVRNASGNNDEEAFLFNWDDAITRVYQAGESEDCLRLNIWTPGIDGKKRPVMVWLHGGGFAAGSGNEQPSYDGENLARRGDVVVVSLNHRLNVLGYLDLSTYGNKFASSANVGMLDIVAALEWVRDNITGFGGDPGVVTIFGQSGGGSKVSVLMGMPCAKGLFHRAVVESGSLLKARTQESAQEFADQVVAELGLTHATIDQIQSLPFSRLQEAVQTALSKHVPASLPGVPNTRSVAAVMALAPVVDGRILPAHPFDPRASEISADVPMIVGNTLNEFNSGTNHPEYESMTETEMDEKVRALYGDKTPQVVAAFRQRTPTAKPFDLWSQIAAGTMRQNAIKQVTAKAALGKAPAFLYWFTWKTPVLDGRPRAFHCAEIAFVFANAERCDTMTGGGPDALALEARVSDAWIHFARTGNPTHPGIPTWTPFSPDTVPTMIFDNHTELVNNPDGAEQRSIAV
jgi:para-nitrobenzyl esterase